MDINSEIYTDLSYITSEFDKVLFEEFGISDDSFISDKEYKINQIRDETDGSEVCSEITSEFLESISDAYLKVESFREAEEEAEKDREEYDSDDDDDACYEYTTHSSTSTDNLFDRILDCSIFSECTDCNNDEKVKNPSIIKSKRKKSKKKISSRSNNNNSDIEKMYKNNNENIDISSGRTHQNDQSDDFITVISYGIKLLLASSIGSTKSVLLIADGHQISWGLENSKPLASYLITKISHVSKDMPIKYLKSFKGNDYERSFTIYFGSESQSVSFLAPSSLERDALLTGFQSMLLKYQNQ